MYLKWCVSGQNGMTWETGDTGKPARNVTTRAPRRLRQGRATDFDDVRDAKGRLRLTGGGKLRDLPHERALVECVEIEV